MLGYEHKNMGVLPLQFENGESADSLGLTGKESSNKKAAIK
ncbi:hypothetical protein [uncultured Virgibacillus sp.]|nr:hypothetical protein [uncultured Virgibacillus sp.]